MWEHLYSKLVLFSFFWGPSLTARRDSRSGLVWRSLLVFFLFLIYPFYSCQSHVWHKSPIRLPSSRWNAVIFFEAGGHHIRNGTGGDRKECWSWRGWPGIQRWPRSRPFYAGNIWQRSFISMVRPSVHTNPSRKRSFWKMLKQTGGIWKRQLFFSVWTENILKTRWCYVISLTEYFSITNPKWPVIVAFLNFSGVLWTENIWCVFRVKPLSSNSSAIMWTWPLTSHYNWGVGRVRHGSGSSVIFGQSGNKTKCSLKWSIRKKIAG